MGRPQQWNSFLGPDSHPSTRVHHHRFCIPSAALLHRLALFLVPKWAVPHHAPAQSRAQRPTLTGWPRHATSENTRALIVIRIFLPCSFPRLCSPHNRLVGHRLAARVQAHPLFLLVCLPDCLCGERQALNKQTRTVTSLHCRLLIHCLTPADFTSDGRKHRPVAKTPSITRGLPPFLTLATGLHPSLQMSLADASPLPQ